MSDETKAVESPISNGAGASILEESRITNVQAQTVSFVTAYSCPAGCVMFRVGQKLAEVERVMILGTMELTRGNRTRAAKFLGVSVRTLYTKLLKIDQENALRAMPGNSTNTLVRAVPAVSQR
jgi:DNA-binding NtrC family response regulator